MKGEQLKTRRESLGLSQVQFAAKLEMHPMTISRFERGADSIPLLFELALCELERRLAAKKKKPKK